MGSNELIVRKSAEVAKNDQWNNLFTEIPNIKYSLIDLSKYSFEYKINDDIDVNMFESDRTYDSNDFVDVEFEDAVSSRDYSYYTVAVASGVLTGVFSRLKLSEELLDKINEWKSKDWEKYIIIAAQMSGYKHADYKGSLEFLKNRFVPLAEEELNKEFQEGLEKCLMTLSSHPSVAGLVFSIFTQFSTKKYSFDDKSLKEEKVPEYYAIGRNPAEKIVYGFMYWVFYLSADVVISKRSLLDDMKIPKEVLKMLKELFKLSPFKNIPQNYTDSEKLFSTWINRIFEKSQYKDEDGKTKEFSLIESIDALDIGNFLYSTPILINECIVRTFYVIKKLIIEIKENDIISFDDMNKITFENVLPYNNRLISKMVLISSGCFTGINIAGATLKTIMSGSKGKGEFAKTLITEINIAGVGRFVCACIADSKYWGDDIKIFLQRKEKSSKTEETKEAEKIIDDMMTNDSFKILSMTPAQTRALYSLEALEVMEDIEHTEKSSDKAKKKLWLDSWKTRILYGLGIDSFEYFITDENAIYDALCSVEQTQDNLRWFYLLSAELVEFKPYYPLGIKEDVEFKKLRCTKYNYIEDQFIRRQTIVIQAEIDNIRDIYKKYKGLISGNTQNTIIAVGVTTATAIATGGLAFAFAPGIATLIAGEAVVGLHGAALTSASLAFVGGGSLAAGGLGMAGGTAIITGGGALLGIAGTSSASMAAILSQTGSEYWIRQSTKLLVFCKCVLKEKLGDIKSITNLSKEIAQTIIKVEGNLKELEEEKCSLDKEVIKNSKDCLKYLSRCKTELDKLAK